MHSPRPALYVHIPFCISKCDYCDFFSIPSLSVSDEYISAVLNEAQLYAQVYGIKSYRTVYIGGGTPSLLTASQLTRLFYGLYSVLPKNATPPLEVTVEANPESITQEKLSVISDFPEARLSVGIQSFSRDGLRAVKRHCTAEQATEALALIKSAWHGKLSVDIMAGLPCAGKEEATKTVSKIISYAPEHISLYALTVEEGTPLEKHIGDGLVHFDSDLVYEEWENCARLLLAAGYERYEVSNFAKKGYEAIHNSSYWEQYDYIGIGAGATGTVYSFANGVLGERWTNTHNIQEYIAFWNKWENKSLCNTNYEILPRKTEFLDLATQEFEAIMLALRTKKGISTNAYKERYAALQWKGDIEARLGVKDGAWKDFATQGKCLPFGEKRNGDTFYALNDKGLDFLNTFLINLD